MEQVSEGSLIGGHDKIYGVLRFEDSFEAAQVVVGAFGQDS